MPRASSRSSSLTKTAAVASASPSAVWRPVIWMPRRSRQRIQAVVLEFRKEEGGDQQRVERDVVEPDAALLFLELQELQVEGGIVRDQRRAGDERVELRQHDFDGRGVGDHGVGDAVELDRLRRDRPARVDQAAERLAGQDPAVDDPDGADRDRSRRPARASARSSRCRTRRSPGCAASASPDAPARRGAAGRNRRTPAAAAPPAARGTNWTRVGPGSGRRRMARPGRSLRLHISLPWRVSTSRNVVRPSAPGSCSPLQASSVAEASGRPAQAIST